MVKISALTVLTSVAGDDVLPINDTSAASETKQTTVSNVAGAVIAYQEIGSADLGGLSSYTFGSIPQTFGDLVLVVNGQLAATMTAVRNLQLRFNGDTGANYDVQRVTASGTNASATETLGSNSAAVGQVSDLGVTSLRATVGGYAQIGGSEKVLQSLVSRKAGTSPASLHQWQSSVFWRSSAAITSITVNLGTTLDSFAAGSTARLYGVSVPT